MLPPLRVIHQFGWGEQGWTEWSVWRAAVRSMAMPALAPAHSTWVSPTRSLALILSRAAVRSMAMPALAPAHSTWGTPHAALTGR